MASSSGVICRKRGNESFISNEVCSPPKKISYFYILEPESDVHSEDGTESIYSIQDKSTDCAKDTSDTSDTPDESDDSQSEYEVASLDYREQGNPIDHEESSSLGTDEGILKTVTITTQFDEGDNLDSWADSSSISSEPSDLDPELSHADFWTCAQCKNTNNNPLFRYCEKCFKVRKNFFPPRPRGKKKRKPRTKKKLLDFANTISSFNVDSGLGSITISEDLKSIDNDSQSDDKRLTNLAEMKMCEDKIEGSLSSFNADNLVDISSEPSTSKSFDSDSKYVAQISKSVDAYPTSKTEVSSREKTLPEEPVCSVCYLETKNGIFVHGTLAHIYSCYRCSIKIWKDTGRCPICNAKVSQVLKAVFAF